MDSELPSEFDLIVVGTGMTESIIAAAASRIEKKVLHIDNNNYYGGPWASFSLDSIGKLSENQANFEKAEVGNSTENFLQLGNDYFGIRDVKEEWHVQEGAVKNENADDLGSETEKENWTKESLLKLSRKFNIDLSPRLHFARGDFVELLISSNIARYSEFRSVSRVLTWINNKLEVVPCSRSDVFSSNTITVVEKRMLMKLLNTCLDGTEQDFASYENKSFYSYLKDHKLTDNLIHYILYAIAMGTEDMPCKDGVERIKRFLNSLGRYGKTPFLYSMYGSGEIPQAFCRLSAVFGGIYALSQPLKGLVLDENKNFKSIFCGQQQITAPHLVMGVEKAPKEFVNNVETPKLSRGIFITNKSMLASEKEHLSLLLFPPLKNKNPITIFEMGSLTGTCPKGLYLVHMYTRQLSLPEEDLKECVDTLFTKTAEVINDEGGDVEEKPQVLWSFYFSVPLSSEVDFQDNIPANVFISPGPDSDLDYDPTIKNAKDIFEKIYPNSEFLPRAPDPEEIIIEGENVVDGDGDLQNNINGKCEQQNQENEQNEKTIETSAKEN